MGVTWACRPVMVDIYPFEGIVHGSPDEGGFRVYGRITARLMALFELDDPGWRQQKGQEAKVVPPSDADKVGMDLSDAVHRLTTFPLRGDKAVSHHVVGVHTAGIFRSIIRGELDWDGEKEVDRGGRFDERPKP